MTETVDLIIWRICAVGSTCVVGLQWGDEAKGKIVDLLCDQHDVVVRYQGGANAGPHGRRRRGDLQALAGADGDPPAGDRLRHRQRRGDPPARPAQGDRDPDGAGGGRRAAAAHQRPGPRHPALSPGRGAADRGIGLGGRPPGHHPARDRAVLSRQGRPGARRPGGRSLPPGPVPRTARPDRRLQEPAARGDAPRLRPARRPRRRRRSTSIMPSGCGRSSATRRPGCTRPSSRAAGSSSRAPRARCWTSTTAAIRT